MTARALEAVRCPGCFRTMARMTRAALAPGGVVEIKCPWCNTIGRRMGPPVIAEAVPQKADRSGSEGEQ
jgi:phage FluMu protein Com